MAQRICCLPRQPTIWPRQPACMRSRRACEGTKHQLADLSLIHGGIGTVMTAAYAGKPVVGVGMQPEQVANLACLVRKGFAIRVPKSKDPSRQIQAAIARLLHDAEAKRKAEAFAQVMEHWDGPRLAANLLYEEFGS
jgi:UDP:flavonoid glycosyltransferase YjiC (YdhE family)